VNNIIVGNVHGDFFTEYQKSDTTSVDLYGSRFGECTANTQIGTALQNIAENPSFETPILAYTTTNWNYSTEQPANDSTGAWAAKSGNSALRIINTTGAGVNVTVTDDVRIVVSPSTTYYLVTYGANSNTTLLRGRGEIRWYDDAGALISTSYGSYVTYTTTKTWYKITMSAASPATAVYARIGIYNNRSTAAVFPVGTRLWQDATYFGTTNLTEWFDGNFPDDETYLYNWLGTPDASKSFRATNSLQSLATQFLADNSVAKYSPDAIRVNAQANLTAVQLFNLNESIYVWFQTNRWTSVITGITHNITINSDGTTRWMIDLIVRPSTATI
jgi:hypothetical protein